MSAGATAAVIAAASNTGGTATNTTASATTSEPVGIVMSYIPMLIAFAMMVAMIGVIRPAVGPQGRSHTNKNREENKDEQEKPGIKILGYRVGW